MLGGCGGCRLLAGMTMPWAVPFPHWRWFLPAPVCRQSVHAGEETALLESLEGKQASTPCPAYAPMCWGGSRRWAGAALWTHLPELAGHLQANLIRHVVLSPLSRAGRASSRPTLPTPACEPRPGQFITLVLPWVHACALWVAFELGMYAAAQTASTTGCCS